MLVVLVIVVIERLGGAGRTFVMESVAVVAVLVVVVAVVITVME